MSFAEKIAYAKGLAEGVKLDDSSPEGRVLIALIDALSDLPGEIESLEDSIEEINEEIELLNDDMDDLAECCNCSEDEDECECDEDIGEFEVACPKCGEINVVDDDVIDAREFTCLGCGAIVTLHVDCGCGHHHEEDEEE